MTVRVRGRPSVLWSLMSLELLFISTVSYCRLQYGKYTFYMAGRPRAFSSCYAIQIQDCLKMLPVVSTIKIILGLVVANVTV